MHNAHNATSGPGAHRSPSTIADPTKFLLLAEPTAGLNNIESEDLVAIIRLIHGQIGRAHV